MCLWIAGTGCDSQVQVWHDLLSLFERKTFRDAKRYGEVGEMIVTALRSYVREVGTGAFPAEAHSSTMRNDVLDAIMSGGPSNSTPWIEAEILACHVPDCRAMEGRLATTMPAAHGPP